MFESKLKQKEKYYKKIIFELHEPFHAKYTQNFFCTDSKYHGFQYLLIFCYVKIYIGPVYNYSYQMIIH